MRFMNFPLFLTASRLVLAVVVGVLLVTENLIPFHVSIAAVCFIVAAVTDFFDGRLARKWNQTTPLGAFLDPLADKLLVYLAFLYLTVASVYPAWLLLVVFTRDIVTDSLRAYSVGQGIAMPANMVSKWKSLFQMVSIGLLLVLIGIVELQTSTAWGNVFFASFLASPVTDKVFGATFWLMLAAAVTGIVGTVQYFVQCMPSLLKRSRVKR